jgi:hypothetical protein
VLYSCQSHYKIEENETNRNPQDFTSISMENFNFIFSSPCQRQCELLPSLGVRRPLTFHILIFSSETPQAK